MKLAEPLPAGYDTREISRYKGPGMGQQIRFCTSADGVRIAYTSDGSGPPLVRSTFYLNHLELDWQCPVWKPYLQELSRYHCFIRHDMRGFGLSDADAPEQSLDAWVHDLEAVVDAAGVERFPLIGMCHGGCIAVEYAVRHPERVTHLVLFGAYVLGGAKRARTHEQIEARELLVRLSERGWGAENEAFHQVWPALLQPRSTPERLRSLAELQGQSATGRTAATLLRATGDLDISQSAPRVRCPTLVMHSKDDRAASFEQGRLLASLIPGAKLVSFDSCNHVLTDEEPAWPEFLREFRRFLPVTGAPRSASAALSDLTLREVEVLEHIAQGLDNAQIAAHLDLAEKTVRNHITRIFDKLGVENRAQAIVRAREAGLGLRGALA
jgi:pimeloyl-ACP methyl ester carboxylesterase/DNA-binding CsgD family transcriptional regulator